MPHSAHRNTCLTACVLACLTESCRAALRCAVMCCVQDKASVAAAQVPQLLLVPPQEVTARLEALSASMKVSLSHG